MSMGRYFSCSHRSPDATMGKGSARVTCIRAHPIDEQIAFVSLILILRMFSEMVVFSTQLYDRCWVDLDFSNKLLCISRITHGKVSIYVRLSCRTRTIFPSRSTEYFRFASSIILQYETIGGSSKIRDEFPKAFYVWETHALIYVQYNADENAHRMTFWRVR
jgi:hypothetical protein